MIFFYLCLIFHNFILGLSSCCLLEDQESGVLHCEQRVDRVRLTPLEDLFLEQLDATFVNELLQRIVVAALLARTVVEVAHCSDEATANFQVVEDLAETLLRHVRAEEDPRGRDEVVHAAALGLRKLAVAEVLALVIAVATGVLQRLQVFLTSVDRINRVCEAARSQTLAYVACSGADIQDLRISGQVHLPRSE